MVPSYWFSTFVAVVSTAFVLAAAVFLAPDPLAAAELSRGGIRPTASEPHLPPAAGDPVAAAQGLLRQKLDFTDELATLEALQLTLTEVADGSTYVWHRNNGRISGMFQPTRSFKSDEGQVCRHFRVMLTSGLFSRKVEAIACRGSKGVWTIDG